MQVEMVSYSHPSNTRSDGRCCDPDDGGECTGEERCDTYFINCLLPRYSTNRGCPNNGPGFTAVSNVSPDGADIDFSQPTVLGLPNPFNLTGITTACEVKNYCLYSISNNRLLIAGSSALHRSD